MSKLAMYLDYIWINNGSVFVLDICICILSMLRLGGNPEEEELKSGKAMYLIWPSCICLVFDSKMCVWTQPCSAASRVDMENTFAE